MKLVASIKNALKRVIGPPRGIYDIAFTHNLVWFDGAMTNKPYNGKVGDILPIHKTNLGYVWLTNKYGAGIELIIEKIDEPIMLRDRYWFQKIHCKVVEYFWKNLENELGLEF